MIDLIEGWGLPLDLALLVLAVISGMLLVLTLLFLVLWRLAAGRREWSRYDQAVADQTRAELELGLSDQKARMRVVRELNEVVLQQLGALVNQADGARIAADRDPALAGRAAGSIAETGRVIIGDMRRVVGIALEGEAAAEDKPQFEAIGELYAAMAEQGLVITVQESGESYGLRPGAELAIYRNIQDALDNSLKFGGSGTRVTVGFDWTPDGLRVRVEDDGRRNQARLAGVDPEVATKAARLLPQEEFAALIHHVTGPTLARMRERVEAFGGVFQASEQPGLGFSVVASYPSLKHHNGVHGVNLGR